MGVCGRVWECVEGCGSVWKGMGVCGRVWECVEGSACSPEWRDASAENSTE
jgi:hypothetical protein